MPDSISYGSEFCQGATMQPANIAIIGGTGFESLPSEIFADPVDLITEFGAARALSISDNYTEPHKLYFLSRHGAEHGLAPHQINYRANIQALTQLGVRYAFATNAVGSLRLDLPVGSLVILDDFIDFTKHRPLSLYGDAHWEHIDFSVPYSPMLRSLLATAAARLDIPTHDCGTYVCCDGPRFESPAEVRLFAHWGGDVVGMTGLPEAVFAREAGIQYAALAIVTNLGAGLTKTPVSHADVTNHMAAALPTLRETTMTAARMLVESWQS